MLMTLKVLALSSIGLLLISTLYIAASMLAVVALSYAAVKFHSQLKELKNGI